MRAFVAFLVGMLLCACCSLPAPAPVVVQSLDHVEAVPDLQSKTVVLLVGESVCSGVWVSPWTIVTADHCLPSEPIGRDVIYTTHADLFPGMALEAKTDGPMRVAVLTAHDEEHDLALLLAIHPPKHGIAYVRRELPGAGTFVQTMGHPVGLWYSYSTGVVAAIREKDVGDGKRIWIQCTAPISPGNSGGGLFDSSGALLGIADAIVGNGSAVYLDTPSVYVGALLDRQGRY